MRLCLLALCFLTACRCDPRLSTVAPEDLRVEPAALSLPETYVGQSGTAIVGIDNVGGRSVTLDVSVPAPFATDVTQLSLAKGGSANVTVTFSPDTAGHFEGSLSVGPLVIPLTAEALAIPECNAAVCHDAHFELEQRQCVTATRPDGEACQTSCVVSGQCASGTCVGTAKACDDSDACTVDACAEARGCTHVERRCPPPANPCQVAACDSVNGCGAIDADDGTLCGPDDCLLSNVSICVSGQCVTRVRPIEARCVHTWVPTAFFARVRPAVTFDSVRHRVLLFGGYAANSPQNDTWEWDGAVWSVRTPVSSPPAMFSPAMVWDSSRSRAVLVGVKNGISQTWEWDGLTWFPRDATHVLPPREGTGLAWDSARRRVVLFGGCVTNCFDETWEWDGQRWEQKHPAVSPQERGGPAMAFDPERRRVVLFGGNQLNDTWEWDGSAWTELRPPVSPPNQTGRLVWNPDRHRVVLFGGLNGTQSLGDLWEWDGATWQAISSSTPPPARDAHGLVWDDARGELLTVAGERDRVVLADTWIWNGTSWSTRTPDAPEARTFPGMAFDERRSRAVVFGGARSGPGAIAPDTWEWDGAQWTRAATTGPSERVSHAMAWDPLHQRVLLFGGRAPQAVSFNNETWEWDGTSWTQHSPPTSPSPRGDVAMTFDEARSQIVMVSRSTTDPASWVWDGTTWAPGLASSPNALLGALSFHEARQQLVFLDGYARSTWTLEPDAGSQWEQVSTTPSPPDDLYAMAYDRQRQRVIAVGSRRATMWEWDGTSWSQIIAGRMPPAANFTNALVFDSARQRLLLFGEAGPWIFLP